MPSRARLDEFIAVVESGDHAGAIERYYTEDTSMQENTAPPRVGRDRLVERERGVLARMSQVYSKAMCSVLEGDQVAIHWIFELTDKFGEVRRVDEVALQQWRGDRIFRERFLRSVHAEAVTARFCNTSSAVEALHVPICQLLSSWPGLSRPSTSLMC